MVRVYLLYLLRFYQAYSTHYCTLVMRVCYITGGVLIDIYSTAYLKPYSSTTCNVTGTHKKSAVLVERS